MCNASTITIIFEFSSVEGDIGSFVSNEVLWLKYKVCPFKSCFSASCFWYGYGLFNWHVMQSLHNSLFQIGAFGN